MMPNQSSSQEVQLISAVGVDYTKLCDLLAAQKWREADKKTFLVMLLAAGRENQGWLDSDSINKFPCDDLRTINSLWLKYSNGRFGFSVQKAIWLSVGGKIDYNHEAFLGGRVGWRINRGEWISQTQINYSLNAPPGHLPMGCGLGWGIVGMGVGGVGVLLSRPEL